MFHIYDMTEPNIKATLSANIDQQGNKSVEVGRNVYYEKFGQLIYQRITLCHQSLAGQSHYLDGERPASWRCSVAV